MHLLQQSHLAGMHIVISRLDNHFSLLHLFSHMRMGHYSVHLHQCMMADGFIQAFGLTHIVTHIASDGAKQMGDSTMLMSTFCDSTRHTSAGTVAEHKQHLHAQVFDGIVHTAHHHLAVDIVAGRTDDENVTDSPVEQQFHRHARIGATNFQNVNMLISVGYSNVFRNFAE